MIMKLRICDDSCQKYFFPFAKPIDKNRLFNNQLNCHRERNKHLNDKDLRWIDDMMLSIKEHCHMTWYLNDLNT